MDFWTATIVSKDDLAYATGKLLLGVQYTNGTTTFTESIDATGFTSDTLNGQIQNRLTVLNNNDALLPQIQDKVTSNTLIQSVEAVQAQSLQVQQTIGVTAL